uniref:Phosphoglycerate mutase n=1 Tax=Guillardia theta TaxID=55529 RepID=A0A7S4NNT6_GUITH|mmetsp:Transcript_27119/g.88648  ORF Transcript_27119/g.88648 Transcript_27119/m.88648 type:complete len:292 (+) Transcript_27119:54-929(+)
MSFADHHAAYKVSFCNVLMSAVFLIQSGVSAGSDIAAKFDAINSNRRDISINIGLVDKAGDSPSSRMPWEKKVLFIRHGVTEMNEYLRSVPYGSKDFVDPGMRDTRLTVTGQEQAAELGKAMIEQVETWKENGEGLDLIVSSPLSRALDTAQLIFSGENLKCIPRRVNPLVRERMWLSSDVGTPTSQLRSAYPSWEFGDMEDVWWYTTEDDWQTKEWRSPGRYVCAGEPESVFRKRLTEFKNWLKTREEQRIVVVAHWGVIYALTGLSLRNCQAQEIKLSTLLEQDIFSTD